MTSLFLIQILRLLGIVCDFYLEAAETFDAMAMAAKAIIATNTSDIPEALDGCGWIVESENLRQLSKNIQYIF